MPSSDPSPFAPLQRWTEVWRSRVEGPARKAILAFGIGAVFGLAHLARLGTPVARLTVLLVWVALLLAWVVRAVRNARGWKDPAWVIARTVVATDPELGQRALRAMRLVDRTEHDDGAGSPELARAHLARTLARVDPQQIDRRASLLGGWLQRLALLAGLLALTAVAMGPFRVVEGLDVLVARRGVAPVPIDWLDQTGLVGHPPDYLHERDVAPDMLGHAEFPYGSLLTVHGAPLHPGRPLVVTDGTTEVPFVDDAMGGVIARWPLTNSVQLRVGARFGEVLIPEPFTMQVTSVPDEEPVVSVVGAPRTQKLLDMQDIEITYEATDDHGLREVHLVLRSGEREERRVLARLDGETRKDRGGHRLWASDRFFKRAYAPIEITVEARDNDPLRGPKWGKSAAITLIPPVVGEPEAKRYRALVRARDAFVDLLAFRIESEGEAKKSEAGPLRAHALRETEEMERAVSELTEGLDISYGGVTVPRRIKTLAQGQIRKLRETLEKEVAQTNARTHGKSRKLTEDFALTLDSVLRRLDVTDATSIAKHLAEIADDAAEGAAGAKRPAERERSVARVDLNVGILAAGGGELLKLGTLGKDLGEIVVNDLARAARTREAADWMHTELALRDLAARLRHPAPSFGGGRSGGVESGGSGHDEGDPSEGGQQIAREQEQIDELARDHAAELSGVEQAMNSAESSEELDKIREEAKAHAEAVREAVRSLPRSGGNPNSAEAAATAAREHAEAMADQLERGSPADAVKSGHNSEGALEQAERSPTDRFSSNGSTHDQARAAREKMAPEVRWAERALERLRQGASARAAEDLKKIAPREGKLAERAKGLSDEGNRGEGALPGETLELLGSAESAMREGARALGNAEGDRALQRLKDAQRLLEMARQGDEGEEPREQASEEGGKPGKGDKDGDSNEFSHRAPIPKAEDYKGPEAFRRRVLEGLGQATDPRLKDAVKRYAEGLLR